MSKATEIGDPTNGAESIIEASFPYVARISIEGVADLIFHRWNVDAVDAKGKAAKGSKAKKTDDLESYVYRDDSGQLCIPGENLRQSIIHAAKFRQDPRSPRKSAMDLFKAALVPLTMLAPLGTKVWDFEDRRRAVVQRSGITRTRPAMKVGWSVSYEIAVILPEYVPKDVLHATLIDAGRLIGVCDFRPTFGRYQVVRFDVVNPR
jgi:hypothetical protein